MNRRGVVTTFRAVAAGSIYFGAAVFCVPSLQAADGSAGAAFLDIPVGAGPAAMGSAYSALATDAYAPIYNPAGLGFVDLPQVAAQHLDYLDSVHYEFASFVYPLPKTLFSRIPGTSSLGASIQYLGSGDMVRTNLTGDSTGDFSSSFAAYSLSYGRTLGDHLSLGVTGKMIHGDLSSISASAYAAELGALYHRDRLSLSVVLDNLGTPLKFIQDNSPLPRAFHLGGAYHVAKQWDVSVEGIYPQSGPASLHTGVQWEPMEFIDVRAGYKTDTVKELSPIAGVTDGIGIHAWGQELAYAWVPYSDLGDAQYLSLVLRFGERSKLKRNLIQFQSLKRNGASGQNPSEDDNENMQLMQLLQHDETRVSQTPEPAKKEAQ